ncbi:MAG: transglutaminase domain-containing protein [Verrucomicrobia bacterium]|nr:transglutaminase domain-containing protein [Verrucomicrobiota bacterium]
MGIATAVCLAVSGGAGAADDAPSQRLFDEWFEITIEGHKVGSVHQAAYLVRFEGAEAIRSLTELKTTFLRDGIPLESTSTTETVSRKDDLAPIGFNMVAVDGQQKRSSAGRVLEGRAFHFETKLGGKVTEKEAILAEGTLFSSSIENLVRRNMRDGWSWGGNVIMESDVDIAKAEVTMAAGRGKTACPCGPDAAGSGCAAAAFVSRSTVAGIESIDWRDASGGPVCVSVPAMKGVFRRVGRDKALERFDPFDIFERSLMKPDRPIKGVRDLESVTLELVFDGAPADFPEDERQKVVARNARSVTLKLRRVPEKPSVKRPVQGGEHARFLKPTEYEQSDAPEIALKAKELTWTIDDALDAAKAVHAFAHGRIARPGMGKGYLSAVEVLKEGEGDCTEYSVLASALAKAAGLPTRLVTGAVYVDGVFGFHAWLEIFVGYWQPFDPTLDEISINPTHIKLWTGVGEPGALRDAAVAVLRLFTGVKIRVVETK